MKKLLKIVIVLLVLGLICLGVWFGLKKYKNHQTQKVLKGIEPICRLFEELPSITESESFITFCKKNSFSEFINNDQYLVYSKSTEGNVPKTIYLCYDKTQEPGKPVLFWVESNAKRLFIVEENNYLIVIDSDNSEIWNAYENNIQDSLAKTILPKIYDGSIETQGLLMFYTGYAEIEEYFNPTEPEN